MRLLENSTTLVSEIGMFSRNETVDEIPTEHLQYLLLPALLGSLSLKLTSGDRKNTIDVADIYYKDFLQRCNDYGLSNYDFKEKAKTTEPKSSFEELRHSVNTRANKIQRFREQKELKDKLQSLKAHADNDHVDEEMKREYFLTMIKLFIYEAVDELSSIEMEKPILEHMANLNKGTVPKPKRIPSKPLQPIIITKDELQKEVFGAGYPSLPTMTVEEFYEKRVNEGIFPDPDKVRPGNMSLQEAAMAKIDKNSADEEVEEQERLADRDDVEYLDNMRNMDEYKDDHRRGWGNRMNRS